MTDQRKQATVGPWAKEKLDALRQYLKYYTTVLKKQGYWLKGATFVDAFAGAGTAKLRRRVKTRTGDDLLAQIEPPDVDSEEDEFIKGSPRVALDIVNPFTRYVFVDIDQAWTAELEELRREYGDSRRIEVRNGTADDELRALLTDFNRPRYRGVVFIDPFGMHISWDTIEPTRG